MQRVVWAVNRRLSTVSIWMVFKAMRQNEITKAVSTDKE